MQRTQNHPADAQDDPDEFPGGVCRGRGWQDVPVSVTQRVLTHPTLSLAARGLYAVVAALDEDPEGVQAVIGATPNDLRLSLVAELIEAGYAWRNDSGGFTLGEAALRDRPEPLYLTEPSVPAPRKPGWAYAVSNDDRRLVKIGTSTNVAKRLSVLQTSHPGQLEILWQDEGGVALEEHLHATFARRRVRGEWFDFTGSDAVALITAAAQSFGRTGGAR